jgi:UDP-2,3-diacylglucosamine hydrolase
MRNQIYFASDFHLGVPTKESSLERERAVVAWLEYARKDAAEIFLVGDIFDFWFEYKRAVPRGYTRLLGKISEITDSGIPVHVFTGNHDMWIFDYLSSECGVKVYRNPIDREFNGKLFQIGHGDGLGPGDHGYKFIKRVFANRICQWLFARLHPNFGIWLASYFSGYSRSVTGDSDRKYLGDDKEWLVVYCKEAEQLKHSDYYIFGHRHLPLDIAISNNSRYINLGEWLNYRTFAKWSGEDLELFQWTSSGAREYKI